MLIITGFYASILAFIIILLGYRVVKLRMKFRVGLLDGGHPELIQAIRIHGNAIEWTPITLMLFACAESQHLMPVALHTLGIIFLLARCYHIYGLSRHAGKTRGRFYGMIGTWAVAIILGGYNIFRFIQTHL